MFAGRQGATRMGPPNAASLLDGWRDVTLWLLIVLHAVLGVADVVTMGSSSFMKGVPATTRGLMTGSSSGYLIRHPTSRADPKIQGLFYPIDQAWLAGAGAAVTAATPACSARRLMPKSKRRSALQSWSAACCLANRHTGWHTAAGNAARHPRSHGRLAEMRGRQPVRHPHPARYKDDLGGTTATRVRCPRRRRARSALWRRQSTRPQCGLA